MFLSFGRSSGRPRIEEPRAPTVGAGFLSSCRASRNHGNLNFDKWRPTSANLYKVARAYQKKERAEARSKTTTVCP